MKKDVKKELEKIKGNKFINEFKDFIAKGNVVDLAVGVIIGGAFGKIVTSIVSDILMPVIGVIIGGHDFTALKISFGNANIMIGNFIQNVIDFLIIAICIFVIVKLINKLMPKKEEVEETTEPVKSDEVVLLEEIRDLLKDNTKSKTTKKTKEK